MVLTGGGETELRSAVGTSPFMLLAQYDFIAPRERDCTWSSHPEAYIKKRSDKSQPRKHIVSIDYEGNPNSLRGKGLRSSVLEALSAKPGPRHWREHLCRTHPSYSNKLFSHTYVVLCYQWFYQRKYIIDSFCQHEQWSWNSLIHCIVIFCLTTTHISSYSPKHSFTHKDDLFVWIFSNIQHWTIRSALEIDIPSLSVALTNLSYSTVLDPLTGHSGLCKILYTLRSRKSSPQKGG